VNPVPKYNQNDLVKEGEKNRACINVGYMTEIRNAYMNLVGKPERKRPLGRRRCRWDHNIALCLLKTRIPI
jgi:hypothetical protein